MTSKLAEVKSALAEKYARLAKVAKSRGRKRKWAHKAEVYRRQVADLGGR